MSAARPLISVQKVGGDADQKVEQLTLPSVFLAPIRPDVVRFVHLNMAKNSRQPYAVSDMAGHQHSAESWGTGRAVARIPRVSGGGTSRSGQGAFGNMCRKGHMYAPTRIWRKWHRKINVNQKRYAVASALAASAVPALVMGRGHRVEQTPEIPLVIPTSVESIAKTKKAVEVLKAVGAYEDSEKAKDSKKTRAGKGKMRNRRTVARRGPLVVYNADHGVCKAFRNLPGVELCRVDRLNLLQLAPGGHLGRFVVWTQAAFERLDKLWGSTRRQSEEKTDYKLPSNIMANTDITRIINSDEVQSKVRAPVKVAHRLRHKNPLKNLGVMVRLNPYALSLRRAELLSQQARRMKRAEVAQARKKNVQVKKDAALVKKAAAAKKHRPLQKLTYARISSE